ncbi:MAG: hybrid sensor histidine kinase/response regulator [Proteobacteria bacterium]|nr:MAG: hybrid sensor histidine kinase/response regulator [Pseudomonadota bacterium]
MRLSVEHFDRLLKTSGEVISFTRNQDEAAQRLRDMYRTLREMQKEWNAVQKNSTIFLKNQHNDPDKIRFAKYFAYVETQIRNLGRQLRSASTNQNQDSFILKNLGEKLQDDVQNARMISAGEVFESFPKMMRDLAKDDGKEIEFSTAGMDLEADRLVLQAIKDPLMHILRNALSHGIESPDKRLTTNKPKSGNIRLSVEMLSRRLVVKINDDGRGLNLTAIKSKALENGLANQAELDSMSEAELNQLIFSAGFSTAEKISDISGRGVGLNVVREATDKLQGEVFVESTEGFGTRFVISVPLSLSNHRLLLLKSQNQIFAIPTYAVQSVQRAKRQDLTTIEGRHVIKNKDVFIPIMALSNLLGMKETSVTSDQDTFSFAILKLGEKRLALAVDSLVGEKEGLIKELGLPLSRSNRFAGGILLDRNAIALVIHPPSLFEAYLQLKSGRPLEIAQKAQEKPKLRILVVDDSFTTRILEKSILEAKGYNVSVATDGLEALAFLKAHDVDLIISDVEMPRMDGLALLREVRSMPRTAKTPVIMVSSRDTREEQERGLNLGADAYLSKQEFNQTVLLDTIRQVV